MKNNNLLIFTLSSLASFFTLLGLAFLSGA